MNIKYQELIKKLGKERIKLNELLSEHTSYKIGGPAEAFYEAKTEEELVKAVKLTREMNIAFFILGGGSNILVGDKGFRGLIIKLSNYELRVENGTVTAGAGLPIPTLLNKCFDNSLTGLEFMAGIPGTVGGAVRGNAGAWQESIGDFVSRVKILTLGGEVIWIAKDKCSFAYRESRFKKSGEIILEVEFLLNSGNQSEINKKIMDNLQKRETQPKEPSAGCIFVNPKPLSAGALIDQCGLKGKKIGGAQISEKHANFFINAGGAKAKDMVALIDLARSEVKNKFAVELKEEIVRMGEF